jgi:hypothetical protein
MRAMIAHRECFRGIECDAKVIRCVVSRWASVSGAVSDAASAKVRGVRGDLAEGVCGTIRYSVSYDYVKGVA